ncbi:MAG: glycosyltransferase family 2 protein [Methanobacterium paludis]|nr:glycosyltransferase family 2 protein [Methanobacterium paludis]
MNPKVAVIILNWNGWEDTIECLESLYQINYPSFNVIVVDNNSQDDSIEKIKNYCEGKIKPKSKFFEYTPNNKPIKTTEYRTEESEAFNGTCKTELPPNKNLILIKNTENYGFAEGNNIGIRYAIKAFDPDYTLLLNNDTVVNENFLTELVKTGESSAEIGVVGPKIYYYDADGRTDVVSNVGGVVDLSSFPGYYDLSDVNPAENYKGILECDWVSGAALMMKTRDIPIKLLNKELFFGMEDIDLCIKLREHGYKIMSNLNSKIWHKTSVSRKKKNLIKRTFSEISTSLKFLKTHQKLYYIYLPLYVAQILKINLLLLIKKVLRTIR